MGSSNIKHLIISSSLCLSTIIIFLTVGKNLSEVVPVHWNFSGKVNGTIAKVYLVYGAPVAYLLVNLAVFYKFKDDKQGACKYYLVPIAAILLTFMVILLAFR